MDHENEYSEYSRSDFLFEDSFRIPSFMAETCPLVQYRECCQEEKAATEFLLVPWQHLGDTNLVSQSKLGVTRQKTKLQSIYSGV